MPNLNNNNNSGNIIEPGVTYYDLETKGNYFRLTDSTNECCATGPATDTVEHNSTKPVSIKQKTP